MSYTCFPRLELQAVAHQLVFWGLELYTTDELARDLSDVWTYIYYQGKYQY